MSLEPTQSASASTSSATDDEHESALETARRQLEHAATHIDLDQAVVERLKHPQYFTKPVS